MGKTKELFELLKLKKEDEFMWKTQHEEAFKKIKGYLTKPPILMPPRREYPLRLYVFAIFGFGFGFISKVLFEVFFFTKVSVVDFLSFFFGGENILESCSPKTAETMKTYV